MERSCNGPARQPWACGSPIGVAGQIKDGPSSHEAACRQDPVARSVAFGRVALHARRASDSEAGVREYNSN